MKTLSHVLLVLAVIFLLSSRSAAASDFLLTSPDHPAVWYNRAGDKVSERLVWDDSRHEMVSYVAYDRVQFLPLQDQTYYDTFRLAFPTVRLDEATLALYFIGKGGHRITIGHLESGILGNKVVLNQGVEFSEHRHDGVVRAAISSGDSHSR